MRPHQTAEHRRRVTPQRRIAGIGVHREREHRLLQFRQRAAAVLEVALAEHGAARAAARLEVGREQR